MQRDGAQREKGRKIQGKERERETTRAAATIITTGHHNHHCACKGRAITAPTTVSTN